MKKYWHIVGFNSSNKIFDKKIKAGCFSENQIESLLMALVAKAGLSNDEIVGAYAKKNTLISNELLSVHKDGRNSALMCGSNPHFIATIITDD